MKKDNTSLTALDAQKALTDFFADKAKGDYELETDIKTSAGDIHRIRHFDEITLQGFDDMQAIDGFISELTTNEAHYILAELEAGNYTFTD